MEQPFDVCGVDLPSRIPTCHKCWFEKWQAIASMAKISGAKRKDVATPEQSRCQPPKAPKAGPKQNEPKKTESTLAHGKGVVRSDSKLKKTFGKQATQEHDDKN